ncbi:hypothetical protein [Dactylosporangium sp. NPDC049140]|uniref:hypothetical protein n=1 Tax=Dactylosporangium sp. NPDC049140 TaxID=3155647 RepID=UPI0033DE7F04
METALRDWVRERFTPRMLDEMAQLDYGMHAEENRTALEDVLRDAHLPTQLGWPPREVLELASHGGAPLPRLFACTVLVRAGAGVPSKVVAGLVESALEVGAGGLAADYVAWCRAAPDTDEETRPFLALALMLLTPERAAELMPEIADVPARELRPWRRLNGKLGQPVRLP